MKKVLKTMMSLVLILALSVPLVFAQESTVNSETQHMHDKNCTHEESTGQNDSVLLYPEDEYQVVVDNNGNQAFIANDEIIEYTESKTAVAAHTHTWVYDGAPSSSHSYTPPGHYVKLKCSYSGCTATSATYVTLAGCTTCFPHTHQTSGQTIYCDASHPHNTFQYCATCTAQVYNGGSHTKYNCSTCHSSHNWVNNGSPSSSHTEGKGHEVAQGCNYNSSCNGKCPATNKGYITLSGCSICYPHSHSYSASSYYQTAHPHYKVNVCSCGAEQLTSTTSTSTTCCACGNHSLNATKGYDAAHPHQYYWYCTRSGCTYKNYIAGDYATSTTCYACGNHSLSSVKQQEEGHPHRKYWPCTRGCGYRGYTGEEVTVSGCTQCYPQEGFQYMYDTSVSDYPRKITSRYGERVRNGVTEFHHGFDIVKYNANGVNVSEGIPLYSAYSGYVIYATENDMPNDTRGHYIVVKTDKIDSNTGENITYQYMHLRDAPLIASGGYINKGQLIGYTGNTGDTGVSDNDYAPHLHMTLITQEKTLDEGQWKYTWTAGRLCNVTNTKDPVIMYPNINFVY